MVARAIDQTRANFRGARAFEQRTDLFAVGRLLEEAFRPEHNFPFSDLPLLRAIGIWMWTLNYTPSFPESLNGFVWIEDGRIVGNVTLGFDQGCGDRYYISNVAVKPEYRRQGIARALMQVTLEHCHAHAGKLVLLNVRPNNSGAIQLYRDLGFKALEMRGEWILAPARSHRTARQLADTIPGLRPLAHADDRAVPDLMRATVPPAVLAYRPRQNDFEQNLDDRMNEWFADIFLQQSSRRWVVERDGRLAALLMMRAQRVFSPHRLTLAVHPDFRGTLEADLVQFALNQLTPFPEREVFIEGVSTHPQAITALEQSGFTFKSGLTLMQLEF